EVVLEVVLPFAEEDYPGLPGAIRKDFDTASAAELRRLEAVARQTVCLMGTYSDETSRERAYQDARDMLLQNADILIAIYDPTRKPKKAGTVETVEIAMRMRQ